MVVGVDRCDRWNVPPLFDEVIAADADEEDGDEVSNCQGGEGRGHKRLEQDDEWRVREVRQRGTNKPTALYYNILYGHCLC